MLAATVSKNDSDMGPVLTAVKNSKADLLFFPLFQPEGNHVLLQAKKDPAFNSIILMSDGSLIEQSFIDAVKNAAKGMYFVGPTPPKEGPELSKLQAEYLDHFRTSPSTFYYTSAYDAAELLFQAIEKTAEEDKSGVKHIGRQALRQTLYATQAVQGISGSLACDEFGDCARSGFNVLRLKDPKEGVEGLKANVQFTYSAR